MIEIQKIETKIYELRNQKIILDFYLSEMYEVETRVLKQAVKRNIDRFPADFMFQLTKTEWQEVITNCDNLPDGVKCCIYEAINYLLKTDKQRKEQTERKQIGFKPTKK